jgi:hypothetical protein
VDFWPVLKIKITILNINWMEREKNDLPKSGQDYIVFFSKSPFSHSRPCRCLRCRRCRCRRRRRRPGIAEIIVIVNISAARLDSI